MKMKKCQYVVFLFSQKKPNGSAHYFKIPHTPVMNIHHSSNQLVHIVHIPKDYNISQIEAITNQNKISKNFPYIFFEKIHDFIISKSAYTDHAKNAMPINNINLQCDRFNIHQGEFLKILCGFLLSSEKIV